MQKFLFVFAWCAGIVGLCQMAAAQGPTASELARDCREGKTCLALLIGNDAYKHHAAVNTAIPDVTSVAAALARWNYRFLAPLEKDGPRQVRARAPAGSAGNSPPVHLSNLAEADLKSAWQHFLDMLRAWPQDTNDQSTRHRVALFYFSGHGVDHRGDPLLLPTDLPEAATSAELLSRSLRLKDMFAKFEEVQNELRARGALLDGVFIIDACRVAIKTRADQGTKPFARTGGLSPLLPPAGLFALYAATTGQVANTCLQRDATGKPDCAGEVSVFTKHLLDEIGRPQPLQTLAATVRWKVFEETSQHDRLSPQTPDWFNRMIGRDDMHIGGGRGALSAQASSQPVVARIANVEPGQIVWEDRDFPELVVMEQPATFERLFAAPECAAVAGEASCVDGQLFENGAPPPIAVARTELTRAHYRAFLQDKLDPQLYPHCRARFPRLRDKPTCPAQGEDGHAACRTAGEVEANVDKLPVANVSWDNAQTYVDWLNCRAGLEPPEGDDRGSPAEGRGYYRLPTEVEWEFAARGGQSGPFAFGGSLEDASSLEKLCSFGNGADSSLKTFANTNRRCDDRFDWQPAPVGSFEGNAYGLQDVHGNVWEWVDDCWSATRPTTFFDPRYAAAYGGDGRRAGGGPCSRRVARGGSWLSGPESISLTSRTSFEPSHRRRTLGFRVVRVLGPCEIVGRGNCPAR